MVYQVAEAVSKYCVLLHIPAGSSDAAQFSSICILILSSIFQLLSVLHVTGHGLTYCYEIITWAIKIGLYILFFLLKKKK